jgi:tetratricopeptide (TPR) repeat protein
MDDNNSKIGVPVPFSTLMLFRCTKRKYAEQFVEGNLYFGTSRDWINIEKKGQGDILEGVYKAVKTGTVSEEISKLKTDSQIDYFDSNGYTFFRRKEVLNLRCLCIYGLHSNSFEKHIGPDGRAHYNASIPKSYFRDFSDCCDREDYKKIDTLEQPVVVFITNVREFMSRIYSALINIGLKEEEIIISPVTYLDLYTERNITVKSPAELLFKDSSFRNQSEVRIIINSKNEVFQEYIKKHNNTISIGPLKDITEINDYYFNDMSVERIGSTRMMYSLPESRQFQIEDMGFFELLDFIMSIINGYVTLTEVPDNCNTWNEKLEGIITLFRKKFNILLSFDEKGNILLQNTPEDIQEQLQEKYYDKTRPFGRKLDGLIERREYENAKIECEEALKDPKLFGAANYYLGKIYAITGKLKKGREAYSKAFEADYKRIESLDGIAAILVKQEEYSKAIDLYKRIEEEKGYESNIWLNIAICYIHLKEYDKAIEYIDKGISKDPQDAGLYYNKGVAYYMLHEYGAAKENMMKAMQLSPEDEMYQREYRKSFLE